MFNSYCAYADDWFYKNTSEEIMLTFYETYKDNIVVNPNNELLEKSRVLKIILEKNHLDEKLDKKENQSNIIKL